jgi:hypothetical protein
MKDFSNMKRNFERVQFAELRKKIDGKYNAVHDELSDCYYNGKPFRTYGVLDKETFDKLHGLIFQMRDVKFHEENLKQLEKDKIPEEQYNEYKDEEGNTVKQNEKAAEKVAKLKTEGIELEI